MLLAIDDFQALYQQTTYRDPLFHYVQSYHLSMPRLILEYASGLKSFVSLFRRVVIHNHIKIERSQRRGAVVGALSMTNNAFQTPLELRDALGLVPFRSSNVLAKRNPDYVTYANGLRNEWIPPRMNATEAAAMTEVWAHNEALHSSCVVLPFLSLM